MRKLAFGIAAATTVVTAAPAIAQVVVREEVVRVAPGYDRWDRPRHREYFARGRDCRFITERRVRPNGTVVVRRIRECD
jgi:hypothetical protein